MKCNIEICFLLTVIAVSWIVEVKCTPRRQLRKDIDIVKTHFPKKHVFVVLEKIKSFGKYEFKHVINKRQAEVPLVQRVIPVVEGSLDDIIEKKEVPLEGSLEPKVIITSIVQPVENGNLLASPFDSRFLITPVEKPHVIVETPASGVIAENESKLEVVAPNAVEKVVAPAQNIIPMPTEIVLTPKPSIEPNVLINTIVENSVPPLVQIPLFRNPNFNYESPVIGSVGKRFMYTDITQIPLKAPSPSPVVVPVSEIILPPQPPPPPPVAPPPIPPPPVIKEDPPKVKQEPPNFFVKGSRLVLYVGSMMLQMLSRLVDGGFNINQIPLPIIPGMK